MTGRRCAACALAAALVAGCADTEGVRAPVVERSVTARPAERAAVAAPSPEAQARHVVARGETLYSIATERGVDVQELAKLNRIDDPGRLRVGQSLRLPPRRDAEAPPAETARAAPAAGSGRLEARALEREPRPAVTASAATETPPAKPEPGGMRFIWPSPGPLLAGFTEQRRGIHIGGRLGDAVMAAAPGKVMYTGTGIRGFGKLIVIRHSQGYNSVYAHNREILVREGDTVARGQKIAELGDSESESPKLHFEIRRSGKPVDPLKYLPDRPR